MHLLTKNVQSLRDTVRFEDFLLELGRATYDIIFLTETWRDEREEIIATPRGDLLHFSGGSMHHGVGIGLSKRFMENVTDVRFHAFSSRVCALDFQIGSTRFRGICQYLPTSWDSDDAVDEVYILITTILDDCRRHGIMPLIGGDFNASIGARQASDDIALLGVCGCGLRNARGQLMIRWILGHQLQVLNRQAAEQDSPDSWTCRRARDGGLVQIDFLCVDGSFEFQQAWCDSCLAIGLDHRCVHSTCKVQVRRAQRTKRPKGMKSWQPDLDADGAPSSFHDFLNQSSSEATSFENIEQLLQQGAVQCGQSKRTTQHRFMPSRALQLLRHRRRRADDQATRKQLSLQVRKLHRQESQAW